MPRNIHGETMNICGRITTTHRPGPITAPIAPSEYDDTTNPTGKWELMNDSTIEEFYERSFNGETYCVGVVRDDDNDPSTSSGQATDDGDDTADDYSSDDDETDDDEATKTMPITRTLTTTMTGWAGVRMKMTAAVAASAD